MISVMFGSARSAWEGPRPRTAGIAACGVYGVAPGRVAVAGPLPALPGGTVWFCLTLSRRPNGGYLPVTRVVKWYLASTCFPLTPPADSTVGQLESGWLGGVAR